MKTKAIYMVALWAISISLNSQNLLTPNTWTVGSGSVSGFEQNGSTAENSREYGIGPEGTNVLLWKATPDSSRNADGGWNSSYSDIDHTKTYRLVIWLKKTSSNHEATEKVRLFNKTATFIRDFTIESVRSLFIFTLFYIVY
ncbi:hypothetical protein ACE1MK_10735 [Tenacibaculum maritimum]|uniref:hypothetical protein n=1 Tax=Tenacibaculum maritimum TaxID=107401 RepID=UPI00132F8825|nr:hypothetical protein [Tenacibaculum maritimum]